MQDTEHPWVARERERYRRKMLRSLDGAAEAAEREDDLDAALDLVERRLAIAPEDERAMAKLLSILVRTGDEAGARRSYQRFSQAAMERGATLSAKVVAAMSTRPESDTATVSALLLDRPPQPLTTGVRDLDAIIGELPTGLVVVASRPRVGATTLLLQLQAHAAIEHHAPTLVFSPDQTESALASRLIAMTASIRIDDLRRGRVPPQRWPKVLAASSSLAEAPLFIDDSSYLQLSEIEDKVHRHAAAHGAPSLIVVDDLPALDEPPARAAEVMAALRRLGRRYEATVVVATQVHLRVEQRTDKRPLVADIAGWDSVVARPDLVLLLYRHELYFPDDEREDELDIIVAENRQGPLGVATVGLRPRYGAIAPDGDAA
jgi:replicative DNA helicase